MRFAYDFYQDNFVPNVINVTFTYTDSHAINPWALADISPVFRNMPAPPGGAHEINEKGFIRNEADAQCFFKMCGGPLSILMNDKRTFTRLTKITESTFFAASRLCDFWGIVAEPVLAFFNYDYLTRPAWENAITLRITFHQIAIRTGNMKDQRYIERVILQAWQRHQGYDEESVDEQYDPEKDFGKLGSISIHNDTKFALHNLYYEHSNNCLHGSESDLTEEDRFIRNELGWNDIDQFGYKMRYNDEFQEDCQ